MNWYEHHIGDYDKNTAHLTACEDGIYSRLIRRYYDKETPLPADIEDVKRLARARTREEKNAVASILTEFFFLAADGWRHKKIDEALAEYRAGEPEREAKKKNEETRLARHRAERAELFATINSAGQHLPWNTNMADLRAAVERIKNGSTTTGPATPPATAPATPATATHPPPTSTHPPVLKTVPESPAAPPADELPGVEPVPAKTPKPPAKAKPASDTPELQAACFATWAAYSKTYGLTYGTPPVRNAKANSLIKQFVLRIGHAEAPHVAAFFLSHQNPLYLRALHPLDLLVKDAEGLRTQWKTGRTASARDTGETAYQRSQREQVEKLTGGLASRKVSTHPPPAGDVIDVSPPTTPKLN